MRPIPVDNPWLIALAMVISAIPPTLAALAAFIAAVKARKAVDHAEARVNGRIDQLQDAAVVLQDSSVRLGGICRAAQQLPPPNPPAVG
jgi:hypothetical protein